MKLHFVGVNTNKLHDELIAAGIVPQLVESLDADTWITVEDSQEATVNAVVAVHDPTPLPPQLTEKEIIADLQARLQQAETDNLNTMLALTEVYEMIIGGA
jgi:hypothetical protein